MIGVRDGSVDFGITGRDFYLEKRDSDGKVVELHGQLGFGQCTLNVIVPDTWMHIVTLEGLQNSQCSLDRPPKVATKFPNLGGDFFNSRSEIPILVIQAEGALRRHCSR